MKSGCRDGSYALLSAAAAAGSPGDVVPPLMRSSIGTCMPTEAIPCCIVSTMTTTTAGPASPVSTPQHSEA